MFLFLGPEFACSKNRVLRGLLFYYSEYICWTEYSQRYSPRPIHHYETAHENMGISPLVSSQSGGARGQESACQCRGRQRCSFDPWVRKIPWSRTRQCTPIFFPGKFNGQRSLAGYIHVVSKNRTQLSRQHTHTHTHTHTLNVTFLVQHCYPSSEKAAPVTFLWALIWLIVYTTVSQSSLIYWTILKKKKRFL